MKDRPIATVIVVTRNRPEILEKMLGETKKLAGYESLEIIVANDGDEVDIKKNLKGLFSEVNFVNFSEQKGYVELRNLLFKGAKSEFVFFLDDDSWFEKEGAIISALGIFREYPRAGILSFRVKLPDGNMIPRGTLRNEPYERAGFIGCANAVRRPFFEGDDIYDGDYFRQGEERDLSIKCLDKGYDILQVDSIVVCHEETGLERDHQFIHGYAFRNELFFYLKYFPAVLCPAFMVKSMVSHSVFCLGRGWFKAYFFGVFRFFKDFFIFLKKRKPVKLKTAMKYIHLNKY